MGGEVLSRFMTVEALGNLLLVLPVLIQKPKERVKATFTPSPLA